MNKLSAYKNSIWKVPLISLIASFLIIPLYMKIIMYSLKLTAGMINPIISLSASGGLLLLTLLLGGGIFLRKHTKKEIFVSAAVVSAYGFVLLSVQLLFDFTTGPMALVFLQLSKPLQWTLFFGELTIILEDKFQIPFWIFSYLRCFVPFLFVLFGRKAVNSD